MLPLKELWNRADLKKLQHVPGPWEKCRKKTWATRMKRRILKEREIQLASKRIKYEIEEKYPKEAKRSKLKRDEKKKKKQRKQASSRRVKREQPFIEKKEQVDNILSNNLEPSNVKDEKNSNVKSSKKRNVSKKSISSIIIKQTSIIKSDLEEETKTNIKSGLKRTLDGVEALEQRQVKIKRKAAPVSSSPAAPKESDPMLPSKPKRGKKKRGFTDEMMGSKRKKLKSVGDSKDCSSGKQQSCKVSSNSKASIANPKVMKKNSDSNLTGKVLGTNLGSSQKVTSTAPLLTSFFTPKQPSNSEKSNKVDKPIKLDNCCVKWWKNSTQNNDHIDFHYGVSLVCKESKQIAGEVTFDRNSNSVWEMELASKVAALEITFGEDFLVLRVNVETPIKRSFEIRFMHWSQMVRTMLNTGYKDRVDSFPVSFKTWRFLKRKKVPAVVSMRNLKTAFVHKTLMELLPIKTAVHHAVVGKYRRFYKVMKVFFPVGTVIRLIWCFASEPAVLCTRLMCELRDGVIAAFDEKLGFDILALGPVLTKFRERALNDLVTENETWVSKGSSSIESFEKILKNEDYKE